MANATDGELHALWCLAIALRARGNGDYYAHVVNELARVRPGVVPEPAGPSDSASGSVSWGELARTLPPPAASVAASELSSFSLPVEAREPMRGEWAMLGVLPADPTGAPEVVSIFAKRDKLIAKSSADPAANLWWMPLDDMGVSPSAWIVRSYMTPQRIVLAGRHGEVRGIDARTGVLAWSWEAPSELADAPIAGTAGVCAITVNGKSGEQRLFALDAQSGVVLWTRESSVELWSLPIAGEGRFIVLPKHSSARRAVVIEAATGTAIGGIELASNVASEDRRAAWIENGLFVLPHFARSGAGGDDAVVAYDIETGRRAWRVAAEETRELDCIVRAAGGTYLVMLGAAGSNARPANDRGRPQTGEILELDTRLGAVRPIQGVQLATGDVPIGPLPNRVTQLDSPYLFIRSPAPGGRETLVRAIHLPYGQRWVYRLPLSEQDLYAQMLPLPALSQSTVALCYTEDTRGRGNRSDPLTHLVLLDRNSGLVRESQVLEPAIGKAENVQLATLGRALFVRGLQQVSILEHPENAPEGTANPTKDR
jgi:hypothetical protein